MPHSELFKEKKFSSLRRDNELFFLTEKVKNGRNRSKFRKTVFHKQIIDLPFQNFMPHVEIMKFCQNHWSLHCYKTLRRIPPPWPDGAGVIGQGRGKWLLYMVRKFANTGTEIFPHFSEIRNFPEISIVISHGIPLPLLVFYIPRCRETLPEFSGDFPLEKCKNVHQVGSNSWP